MGLACIILYVIKSLHYLYHKLDKQVNKYFFWIVTKLMKTVES